MPLARQKSTGVKSTNSGVVSTGIQKTGIRRLGTGGTSTVKVPDGMHVCIVPIEATGPEPTSLRDFLAAGFELLSKDDKEVGTLGHAAVMCPESEYEKIIKEIDRLSDPAHYAPKSVLTPDARVKIPDGLPDGKPQILTSDRVTLKPGDTVRVVDPSSREVAPAPEEFQQAMVGGEE